MRRQFQGNGYGRDPMAFALEQAGRRRKKYAWLGVWERNTAAIAFYEALGFRQAGRHPFRMGEELQSDYIMRRELTSKIHLPVDSATGGCLA